VVGGILLAPVLILLVLPVLIDLFSKRQAWVDEEEEALLLGDGKRRSAELGDV
jgi:hypothetical protein